MRGHRRVSRKAAAALADLSAAAFAPPRARPIARFACRANRFARADVMRSIGRGRARLREVTKLHEVTKSRDRTKPADGGTVSGCANRLRDIERRTAGAARRPRAVGRRFAQRP
ncbi:hypothetical protein WS73_01755 [Burkholderia savannae]|nr:hypothetical protein WS73_01755 [Burkholderia savannae]